MSESYHATQLPLFELDIQPTDGSEKKQCKSCKKWHEVTFFDLASSSEEGIRKNTCKQCRRDRVNAKGKDPEIRKKRREYANELYRSNTNVRESQIKRSNATYARNKEIILKKQHERRHTDLMKQNAKQREYRNSNKEQYLARERLYFYANKEIIYARSAIYRKTDATKKRHAENNRRRNALKRSLPGTFTMERFKARCEYYGWCCYLCGIALTEKTACIEHRIPISRNGTNWPANLAPACRSCNSKKNNRTEKEYREWVASLLFVE